jgi:alkylation response protein AidB-like acyl-CoA dehydrogenase
VDFALTEEQQMVRATARELFARECPPDLVGQAWSDPARGAALWRRHLSGWMALASSDVVDVMLFVEEHGRAMASGPFFASLLAAQVAHATGRELTGPATVAVSAPDGTWTPHDDAVKHFGPSAADVDQIVVVAGSPTAPRLSIAPASEVSFTEVDQMDRLRPQFRLDTAGTSAGEPIDPAAWRHAVERSLVTCSAELIGVGRWLLDTAVEYAKERVQFDRPIGSFQGLQWQLVDAALALERAAAAVAYAAMCVDADDPDRHRAVHGAKAEAGLAARACARTGLQVHGGIGYTWEHGLHFWLRRAYAGDAFMGPSSYHHDRLAELLFDGTDVGGADPHERSSR